MGPKKGVISQSVKDVIQTLVDDDLVLKDKIGTSVYISYLCYVFSYMSILLEVLAYFINGFFLLFFFFQKEQLKR